MDYKKLISNGKSVREFNKKEIEEVNFNEIEKYLKESKKLVQDIDVQVKKFSKSKDNAYEKLNKVAGYNGHMIEAPEYMIILSEVKNGYIENSGYIGENLILKARDLGIDSCWVTFEDSETIKDKLGIISEKEVTAIIALGYGVNTKVKSSSGSNRLGVENIVYTNEWENNATLELLEERALLDAFSYARMAPSTLNRQPWRFIIDGSKVILTVRKDQFASEYEGKIDTGIAMLYFGVIIDTTMFDLRWNLEKTEKDYKIPQDYEVVGYCNI